MRVEESESQILQSPHSTSGITKLELPRKIEIYLNSFQGSSLKTPLKDLCAWKEVYTIGCVLQKKINFFLFDPIFMRVPKKVEGYYFQKLKEWKHTQTKKLIFSVYPNS